MPVQQGKCLFLACKQDNINLRGSAPPAEAENTPDPLRDLFVFNVLYKITFISANSRCLREVPASSRHAKGTG